MIIGLGILLWTVSLLLAIRLAFIGREQGWSPRFRFWLWAVLGAAALALLFRPHEDIFGGEDPGAYINSGITYGRQQQFFYIDPLLSQVPPEIRPDFYYGHSGYGTTKDACLWVREPDRAVIGPHFQPAYPLLIALVSRVADPSWSLYVIPVFTLGLALALRALASLLLPHRLAGLITFLVFLLNPLTLWHGRCSRPEIIAGFMFFGGCALLLNAWQNRRWNHWPDIVLGALAICLAPFFHITAGYLLIPAVFVLAIVILRGRDDFLTFPLIALAGLIALVYQMKWATDYYGLGRFLDPLSFRPALAYGIFGIGFGLLAVGCGLRRRAMARLGGIDPENSSQSISLSWSLGFASVSALFMLVTAFTRDAAGSLPLLGRPIENYLYLADFKTFANMASLPIAILALIGWIVWMTGPNQKRSERIILGLIVFPAIIFSGNIRDLMMTRYWFIALIPMATLGLTALVTVIPDRQGKAGLAVIAAVLLALLGWHHRTQLITMTEYRGLTHFLKPYAEIIAKENGILLCEYSRLAAPFDHFFGIPTLGLDNERRDDYSRAEQAWETIMRKYPDHLAFFMTPFHDPISDRFDFQRQNDREFHGKKLLQARQQIPTRTGEYELNLKLYRMTLKTRPAESATPPPHQGIHLDAGNMGLRHFANLRTETAVFPAIGSSAYGGDALASSHTKVSIMASVPHASISNAILVIALTNQPFLEISDVSIAGQELPSFSAAQTQPFKTSFTARWTRARAEILVPTSAQPGYLVLLAKTPRFSNGRTMQVSISLGADLYARLTPMPERWQWHVVPIPASAFGKWLTITSEPAWDPERAGFPEDLGILVGHLSFWPANSR
ncbi:MAG: hypothetical protein KKG09_00575 [Verrucomicrobia bacterium]|nr:hypothetical protein [Verrucomicrobiota bacterium]MCG2678498.1 hypothetical protein [Kiritimatiellia bacterium]MBU4248004.1 hypothetical protein [Verrucomicrobiota bacterium]MBU4289558.1 hypothetical protein [Verrucomicrobiota bacterium]MBU4427743.1 hypothetical protein [Verrucomicrobiota bacterium]